MKVPKIRIINDWFEYEDDIHVDFMLDIDYHDIKFTNEHSRYYTIPLDEIESYCIDTDLLIDFTDEWDYSSETVRQKYVMIPFGNWMDDYFDDDFLRDYLVHRMSEVGLPDVVISE